MSSEANTQSAWPLLPPPASGNIVVAPRKKIYPTCTYCGLFFLKQSDLKNHLEQDLWEKYEKNMQKTKFECGECCIFFESKQGYKQHIGKVHKKKYKYSKCEICQKKFRNKYAVKFHTKQVHQKLTRKVCPNCGKEFYNKYLLPKHLEKCLRNEE